MQKEPVSLVELLDALVLSEKKISAEISEMRKTHIALKNLVHGAGGGIKWLLRDDFTDTLTAGNVNGTSATPGPGTRTVVDTNSIISVDGTDLVVNGTPAIFDRLTYGAITHQVGLVGIIQSKSRTTVQSGWPRIGFQSDYAGTITLGIDFASTSIVRIKSGATVIASIILTNPNTWTFYLVQGDTYDYLFIKDGSGSTTLYWIYASSGSNDNFAIVCGNTAHSLKFDKFRIPDVTWLPTPLAYDTFTRSNGAIGNSETTGPDSQTVTQRTWTGATWTIDTNAAINTPTEGSDLATNGDFANWTGDDPDDWTVTNEDANNYITESAAGGEARMVSDNSATIILSQNLAAATVGDWVVHAWDVVDVTSGAIFHNPSNIFPAGAILYNTTGIKVRTGRMTNTARNTVFQKASVCDITIDDFSHKQLTLSTLFSSLSLGDQDVVADVDITFDAALPKGTQAGLVLCLDDADTPANFLIAYHDGTNVNLDKCVGGTYTNLIATAATYSAGKTLRVIKDGTSVSVFYNGSQVGTTQTVSDAGVKDNTLHGLFSTHSGNTLDNFTVFPRDGYSDLDEYI